MDREGLTLKKGGILEKSTWEYDDVLEKGSYVISDVTDQAMSHLFDTVMLDYDTTLKDIFMLVENKEFAFSTILGDYSLNLIRTALSEEGEKYSDKYDKEKIEYLEFSMYIEESENIDGSYETWGHIFPQFSGKGFILKEKHVMHEVGDRIPWSIALTPILELVNTPIVASPTMGITKIKHKDHRDYQEYTLKNAQFSLGQLLKAVFDEVSFFGSEENKEGMKESLVSTAYEAKKGIKE